MSTKKTNEPVETQDTQPQDARPLQIVRLNSDNHRAVITANNNGTDAQEQEVLAAVDFANDLADKAETSNEITIASIAQAQAWKRLVLLKLGIETLFSDVLPDNATLVAALNTIHAAGAPSPTVVTEKLWWPGGEILPEGSATVDVYEYTHPKIDTIKLRATEYLLAWNPWVVINDLKLKGII